MALVKRNHNPFAPQEDFLYMIIDRTVTEKINIVKVGNMRRVQLLGQLLAAEGKTVCAPPVENRGLTKLSRDEVNYLFWNSTQQSPEGIEYGDLIAGIIAHANNLEPCDEHIPSLEYLVSQLEPGVTKALDENGNPLPEAPKAVVRPKGTSVTGIIWTICDEVLQELCQGVVPADWKPVRAEAAKRCEAEGFHTGTFGVQYGKWKANKTTTT